MDRRPAPAAAIAAFGADVTVTLPDAASVFIKEGGIWLAPLQEDAPFGADFRAREPRKRMAIARSLLTSCPRGTVILAAELDGQAPREFTVEGFDRPSDPEFWFLILTR